MGGLFVALRPIYFASRRGEFVPFIVLYFGVGAGRYIVEDTGYAFVGADRVVKLAGVAGFIACVDLSIGFAENVLYNFSNAVPEFFGAAAGGIGEVLEVGSDAAEVLDCLVVGLQGASIVAIEAAFFGFLHDDFDGGYDAELDVVEFSSFLYTDVSIVDSAGGLRVSTVVFEGELEGSEGVVEVGAHGFRRVVSIEIEGAFSDVMV